MPANGCSSTPGAPLPVPPASSPALPPAVGPALCESLLEQPKHAANASAAKAKREAARIAFLSDIPKLGVKLAEAGGSRARLVRLGVAGIGKD